MDKISKKGMREQAYEIIKNRILTHQYDLDEPINIAQLSKELSISNTPIREALSQLASEGLVVSTLNSKFRVIQVSDEFFAEVNSTIFALTVGAYFLCIQNGDTKKLAKELDKAIKAQKKIIKKSDNSEYVRAAINFDRCFFTVLNVERLTNNFDNFSNLLFLATRYIYEHKAHSRENNLKQHLIMLEAVKSENHDEVISLISEHYTKEGIFEN